MNVYKALEEIKADGNSVCMTFPHHFKTFSLFNFLFNMDTYIMCMFIDMLLYYINVFLLKVQIRLPVDRQWMDPLSKFTNPGYVFKLPPTCQHLPCMGRLP